MINSYTCLCIKKQIIREKLFEKLIQNVETFLKYDLNDYLNDNCAYISV